MLDIDHFKRFNDQHGHAFGDQVLKQVAEVLGMRVRNCDIVCRWGGEEFAVILADTTIDQAVCLAEGIRSALAATTLPGDEQVTASFGVAQFALGESPGQLFERADCAVNLAKLGGRNQAKYCQVESDPLCHLPAGDSRCCDPQHAPDTKRCSVQHAAAATG